MNRLLPLVFWLAVAVTLYVTLRPITVVVAGSDKTHHAITFGVLMLLAGMAYPRMRLLPLAAGLAGFGALIEIAQPWFARTGDVGDWIADAIGILIALLVLPSARRLFASDESRSVRR